MIRYIVTAAITLTIGVLLGIGIGETTTHRRLTEAVSRSEDLEFVLNDTQDLLAGAQRNLDFWREREASVRKELIATRVALAAAKPPTEAELEEIAVPLAQLVGEDDANDAEWQRLKQANLDAPAKRWSTATASPAKQEEEFFQWAVNMPFLAADVIQPVRDWIAGDKRELDVVIAYEPTGAQYRVTGKKRADGGVECSVKFVGNLNW